MQPVDFPESNARRTAPQDMEDCGDLHIYTDGKVCISKWKLSGDELMKILETGHVWLGIRGEQPPVSVEVFDPFSEEEPV